MLPRILLLNPLLPPSPLVVAVKTTVAPTPTIAAANVEGTQIKGLEILTVIVSQELKKPTNEVPLPKSIRDLVGCESTLRTKTSVTLARSLLLLLRRVKNPRSKDSVPSWRWLLRESRRVHDRTRLTSHWRKDARWFQPQYYQILPLEELGSRTSTCRWCSSPRYHCGACQTLGFRGRGRGVVGRSCRTLCPTFGHHTVIRLVWRFQRRRRQRRNRGE